MATPAYTWYIPTASMGGQNPTSGLYHHALRMAPVVSSGEVLDPVWYTTPELPYSTQATDSLELLVPGLPRQRSDGPMLVGPDGVMYGMVPESRHQYNWRAGHVLPVQVWASTPAPSYADRSVAVVMSRAIAPVPNPAGSDATTYWSSRLSWQDGVVCTADYRYEWHSQGVAGWLYAAGTDVVREGGAVSFSVLDDTRPDSAGSYFTSLVSATVKFADGRTAGATAGEYVAS